MNSMHYFYIMITPPALQKGDHILILAPAKQIEAEQVNFATSKLETLGFTVSISDHCLGRHYYFSGTQQERLEDFQKAIDNPKINAILCARGGYGCVQLVDALDWSNFDANPKWIIGFSDVTVMHQRLQKKGIASIHATMPLNFKENSKEAISTLVDAITASSYIIKSPATQHNIEGSAYGTLLGGNLAILASLIGTNDQPDYTDAILFIEEVGEPLYSIDRMFYSLKKSGILDQIKGLVVGGMTSMKDSEVPYGNTLEEIISKHVMNRNIPVAFDIPSGHIDDNRALILGATVSLNVNESGSSLAFQGQPA